MSAAAFVRVVPIGMSVTAKRAGAGIAIMLHTVALAWLVSYQPARSGAWETPPILVEWISPPQAQPAKPSPPVVKPKAVAAKPAAAPEQRPVLRTAPEAPSPVVPTAPTPDPVSTPP